MTRQEGVCRGGIIMGQHDQQMKISKLTTIKTVISIVVTKTVTSMVRIIG